MYTLYKFHFLNGISEINQLFDDILIIWPAPVYMHSILYIYTIYILSYTGHWKFNMAPHGKELSEDLKKELLLYIKMA